MAASKDANSDALASREWKPRGYHKLARLMGTYNEAALFRRFAPLTMLSLLRLQADIVDLEAQLREAVQDEDASCDPGIAAWSSDFYELRNAEELNPAQRDLLDEVHEKLITYRRCFN